ncbi:MAG: hypothetical protein QOF02_235 [Blastocatellia bacterium]|jgi:TP901 family phage tail tape measure protein|nr:hypothetical protein [Blastocatellia bacterium]
MPSSAVYELALLLSLKDAASGGLDRFEDRLRATGKEGRQLLQTVQDLRKDLRQGLTLAGVGVATLVGLKKGVDTAGDFESAVTDLRLSIEELDKSGSVNLSQLGNQLSRFEQLGMRLGNALPGSTQDFIEEFAVLKQGGLEVETILNGAGEAAAHLAVVMKEKPKDLAEPLAQYGKMFAFQADEYVKAADLFSRIYRATGLRSGELIEGSKFFQLRAGAPLGLKGIEGGEIGARLMAALKSYGLEGGIAGREAAMFFSHMATHKEALQKVKKDFGIDLQIFDKKGNFLGFDNVFKQMEKLRGLKTQQQMQAFKELGGEEGAGIGNIFMQMGEAGWKAQYDKLSKIPALQTQINEATQTYNAKVEAVLGTWENLKATAFTPLLDQAKPILDKANEIVGFIQSFAQAHPTLALVAGDIVAVGGVALTLVGTVKALTAAWRLWRIASAVGSSEQTILAFLRNTSTETTTATTKIGGLRGALTSMPKVVQISLLLVTIGYTVEKIIEMLNAIKEYENADKGGKDAAQAGVKSYLDLKDRYAAQGQQMPRSFAQSKAATAFSSIDREGTLVDSLRGGAWFGVKKFFDPQEWFGPNKSPFYSSGTGMQAKLVKERAPELGIPEVMAEFRKRIQGLDISADAKGSFEKVLQMAFPESFLKSSTDMGAQFTKLNAELEKTNDSTTKLWTAFDGAETSTRRASTGLDLFNLKLQSFTLPNYYGQPPVGGDTSSAGAAPGSPALPLKPSSALPYLPFGKTSSVGDIHINLPPGAQAANDPQALASLVQEKIREALAEPDGFGQLLSAHSSVVEDIVARRIELRRERA